MNKYKIILLATIFLLIGCGAKQKDKDKETVMGKTNLEQNKAGGRLPVQPQEPLNSTCLNTLLMMKTTQLLSSIHQIRLKISLSKSKDIRCP